MARRSNPVFGMEQERRTYATAGPIWADVHTLNTRLVDFDPADCNTVALRNPHLMLVDGPKNTLVSGGVRPFSGTLPPISGVASTWIALRRIVAKSEVSIWRAGRIRMDTFKRAA